MNIPIKAELLIKNHLQPCGTPLIISQAKYIKVWFTRSCFKTFRQYFTIVSLSYAFQFLYDTPSEGCTLCETPCTYYFQLRSFVFPITQFNVSLPFRFHNFQTFLTRLLVIFAILYSYATNWYWDTLYLFQISHEYAWITLKAWRHYVPISGTYYRGRGARLQEYCSNLKIGSVITFWTCVIWNENMGSCLH